MLSYLTVLGHQQAQCWLQNKICFLYTCLSTREHFHNTWEDLIRYNVTARILIKTLRPGKMPATLADDIFKCISLNEKFWVLYRISLKYVPWRLIDNMAALVQIMAWRQTGHKPSSWFAKLVCCTDAYILTHVCVTDGNKPLLEPMLTYHR